MIVIVGGLVILALLCSALLVVLSLLVRENKTLTEWLDQDVEVAELMQAHRDQAQQEVNTLLTALEHVEDYEHCRADDQNRCVTHDQEGPCGHYNALHVLEDIQRYPNVGGL